MHICIGANIISASCGSFSSPASTRYFDTPLLTHIHSFNGSFGCSFACTHVCVCVCIDVCADPFAHNCYHFGGFRASLMCRWRLISSQMQTKYAKSSADVHAHIPTSKHSYIIIMFKYLYGAKGVYY